MAANYLQAETIYVEAAVRTAITQEADEESDGQTLSLLFDSFFVVVKAFQRAVRTSQATLVVVPLLNQIVDILREKVLPVLIHRLHAAGGAEPTNRLFLLAANTVQCAHEYTAKLCTVVTDAFAADFGDISGVADMCVAEIKALSAQCTATSEEAMHKLAHAMMPTAWLLLDFGPADFEVKSDEAE